MSRRYLQGVSVSHGCASTNWARCPTLSVATVPTSVSPHRSVDARGRAIPRTEEEQRRRAEEAIRAMDEIATMGTVEEQNATLDMLMKALDEDPH